jgi:gliding motility-associated-like protein
VVSPTSVTLYTVIGANGNCSSQAQITLSVGLATGISSSGNLCNHSSIDLTASPNGTDYSYAWSGPGITGSTLTSTVNVNAGGVYTVLITNTLTGCIGSSTFQVTSSANPIQLAVNPSSTVSCFPGPPVNILVTAPANLSWLPATEVTPNTGPLVSVNPSVTTSYTVNAISGTCTGSAVITISVNTTPTVTNTGGDFTICAGNSATLSASGASNYVWQPGQITGSSVVVSPFGTTVYTVTGFNGNCVSSVGASVTVLPKPDLITSVFPSTICIGHTATVSASGAVIYSWVDAGILINTPTIIVTPTVSTTYTVIGDNDFGCTSAATVFLNVINSPAISAIASATNICAGETLTLNAAGSENYTWTPGFQTGASISASPSVSTTYTVNGGNSFCSYATVFVLVNVCENTNFGVTLLADEPQELNGGLYKIRFTATAINNSASDFTEVELVNDLARTFLSPLSYTVISAPVVASQNSQLKANSLFDGRIQLSLTSPSSSTLVANKRDTLQFSVLLNPNGFEGVVKNFVIGFAKDKNNQVLSDTSNNGFLWDPDNDGDPTNNNQTTDIRLNKIDLFIPGGFSPDGDGLNDRFIISGLNGRTVKLIVFNRWGNKVYEQDNYDNSWDGTANVRGASVGSGRLPEATYYYILEFAGSKQDVKTGFVVLRH